MKSTQYVLPALVAVVLALTAFSAQATPTTSYYVYDESGHVIGEYDANGNPIQEHIYLGDRPVAVVQNGNAATLDYVTTDQLNTPRAITDSSQTVDWSWNSDPFGNSQPTGSLTYNLRFPGQYYDAETGHNYNDARDYDATIGRYTESDPIGLLGGLNSYLYVKDSPMDWIDRFGLCPQTILFGPTDNPPDPHIYVGTPTPNKCKMMQTRSTLQLSVSASAQPSSPTCHCGDQSVTCTYSMHKVTGARYKIFTCNGSQGEWGPWREQTVSSWSQVSIQWNCKTNSADPNSINTSQSNESIIYSSN